MTMTRTNTQKSRPRSYLFRSDTTSRTSSTSSTPKQKKKRNLPVTPRKKTTRAKAESETTPKRQQTKQKSQTEQKKPPVTTKKKPASGRGTTGGRSRVRIRSRSRSRSRTDSSSRSRSSSAGVVQVIDVKGLSASEKRQKRMRERKKVQGDLLVGSLLEKRGAERKKILEKFGQLRIAQSNLLRNRIEQRLIEDSRRKSKEFYEQQIRDLKEKQTKEFQNLSSLQAKERRQSEREIEKVKRKAVNDEIKMQRTLRRMRNRAQQSEREIATLRQQSQEMNENTRRMQESMSRMEQRNREYENAGREMKQVQRDEKKQVTEGYESQRDELNRSYEQSKKRESESQSEVSTTRKQLRERFQKREFKKKSQVRAERGRRRRQLGDARIQGDAKRALPTINENPTLKEMFQDRAPNDLDFVDGKFFYKGQTMTIEEAMKIIPAKWIENGVQEIQRNPEMKSYMQKITDALSDAYDRTNGVMGMHKKKTALAAAVVIFVAIALVSPGSITSTASIAIAQVNAMSTAALNALSSGLESAGGVAQRISDYVKGLRGSNLGQKMDTAKLMGKKFEPAEFSQLPGDFTRNLDLEDGLERGYFVDSFIRWDISPILGTALFAAGMMAVEFYAIPALMAAAAATPVGGAVAASAAVVKAAAVVKKMKYLRPVTRAMISYTRSGNRYGALAAGVTDLVKLSVGG